MKYVWAILGGGIAVWLLFIFLPSITQVNDVTIAATSNGTGYVGLGDAMTFTPLALIIGFLSLGLIVIAIIVWRKKRGA